LPAHSVGVRKDHQVRAIGEGRESATRPSIHFKSVSRELKVFDDSGVQKATEICGRGNVIPGPDFFGGAGSAEDIAALKNQHLSSCGSEIGSGSQAVMTRTEDDRVVMAHGGQIRQNRREFLREQVEGTVGWKREPLSSTQRGKGGTYDSGILAIR